MRAVSTTSVLLLIVVLGCGEDHHNAREAAKSSGDGSSDSAVSLELLDGTMSLGEHGGNSRRKKGGKIKTWKRSQIVPNTSRLMIGDKEELPLKGLQVDVRIDGFRARVLLDCYYFNDRPQQFEGTFQLRLPNGASPYYFAFGEIAYQTPSPEPDSPQFFTSDQLRDVGTSPEEILSFRSESWRKPKEARIVPREKAAYSYGETVRRQVDPALVEWSGASVFSSRVFPLLPKKLHRIVVGYDVSLLPVGEDLEYRLDLPRADSECVVDLSIATSNAASVWVTPKAEAATADGRTMYRFDSPDDRTITARITKPGVVLLRGNDSKCGPFFATSFRPALPDSKPTAGSSRGVFLVDVSLSSNPERFNVWLKLLQAILENNRDSLKQFGVVFFNVESFWWKRQFVNNTSENVAELMQYANSLVLEGATDLSTAFAEAAKPSWKSQTDAVEIPWDVFLLSDSAATWGESDPYVLSNILKSGTAGPLFAYSTGFTGTDSRMMAHLARETGGAVFSVVGDAEVAKASKAHRSRPWEIVAVEIDGGSDLLLAGRPRTVFPGQSLVLVGRGRPDDQVEVVLKLRQGDVEQVVETDLNGSLSSELAPRIYGQVAVGQLEDLVSVTEEYATAYARQFRVTGRTCSLLMLETEEDYQRFNIKPEEDALVVKDKLASTLVTDALATLGETLGDPKAAFLAWLKKMEQIPGVEFKIPTAFRLALEGMPKASFAVRSPRLTCKVRDWDAVPGNIQEQLASRKLDYDAVTAEARSRLKSGGTHDALRAVSSLVESRPGDVVLARDVGYSAMQWRLGGQAFHLFRRVGTARPFEPQTFHAMARCLEEMGNADLALAYYEVALNGKWPDRFGEFHKIVAMDYLRFLRRVADDELATSAKDFATARLQTVAHQNRLQKCDLVIVIAWNTDRTDVDLHVVDPRGEECFYKHRDTKIGGHITTDVTGGYGPEMFTLPRAVRGKYRVRAKYFSSDRNRATTRTKVYATIYQGWGTKNERVRREVVTLTEGKEMHDIATVTVN